MLRIVKIHTLFLTEEGYTWKSEGYGDKVKEKYYTSIVCDVCQAQEDIKNKSMLDTPLEGMLGGTKM